MWLHRCPLPSTIILASLAFWLAAKIVWNEPELLVSPVYANTSEEMINDWPAETPELINLAAYSATLERPLFVHDRRPIPLSVEPEIVEAPVVAPEPDMTTADAIRLTGIVQKGTKASAIFDVNGFGAWVDLDGFIEDWQVIEVTSNKVTLRREGILIEKLLYAP